MLAQSAFLVIGCAWQIAIVCHGITALGQNRERPGPMRNSPIVQVEQMLQFGGFCWRQRTPASGMGKMVQASPMDRRQRRFCCGLQLQIIERRQSHQLSDQIRR